MLKLFLSLGSSSMWYAVVALVFSANKPRVVYLHSETWIDWSAFDHKNPEICREWRL
ncbi:hypothetical protein O9X99_19720 [Agrobacterium salinitolerans]|uniref:Uncharacterized protein n=1 Tax=Agrobacterium salinitolerans TaxID=1183413 RepID=A0A9X3KRU3_9HYPH|nr:MULTISPECIES: hypothetical protein [Agrobacterium]MCZ7854696.1 hypothetical protein [Agrobacterium salinitolerans]MCZ7893903.1 hypothetical protein [Agrobacterium salinitolerans]MCZ7939854.1 hypothetical protein [Agrobacterium salinitolerans]